MRIVVRLASGNDASTNLDVCCAHAQVSYVITRNPRKESPLDWLRLAKEEGTAYRLRDGKIAYRGETT